MAVAERASAASRPPRRLLEAQAAWLAPARARLLRRVQVATRRRVLDLGCGPGQVGAELARRCGGRVVGLDEDFATLVDAVEDTGLTRVAARAESLPFAESAFDLVFSQWSLVWMRAETVVAECVRALADGGALALLEPDFGGMIEHPDAIAVRPVWEAAVSRAGGDPRVGRRLPPLLRGLGLRVETRLLELPGEPAPERFELLAGLPLTEPERHRLETARRHAAESARGTTLAHLPHFAVAAWKPA